MQHSYSVPRRFVGVLPDFKFPSARLQDRSVSASIVHTLEKSPALCFSKFVVDSLVAYCLCEVLRRLTLMAPTER